jgi:hypothetical protein
MEAGKGAKFRYLGLYFTLKKISCILLGFSHEPPFLLRSKLIRRRVAYEEARELSQQNNYSW